jgi:hypothetical protein
LKIKGSSVLQNAIDRYTRYKIQDFSKRYFAGIISSPRSTYMADLIALHEAPDPEELSAGKTAIDDTTLMRFGLQKGQRSAVFQVHPWQNEQKTPIFLFFLKTTADEVIRVEVPEWIGQDTDQIDRVQASILKDCAGLGYPISLISAHEAVSVPLEIGKDLNLQGVVAYQQHGGRFYLSAKTLSKMK